MGDYKPTEDLLMKADRVRQFWMSFVTNFKNEKNHQSTEKESLLNILQIRKLEVFKSWRNRW
jgi:hypothetical protein